MRRAAAAIRCQQCGVESDELARGWRAYLAPDEGESESDVVFYCPQCAERDFGGFDSGLARE